MKHPLLSALLLASCLGIAETAAAQSQVFVHWPLKRNNADSSAVRVPATGITVSPATLKRFVLSNGLPNPTSAGTTTTAYAPYSSIGQAFSTTAAGASGSATIPGGPRRGFYQQFAITNSGTADLRVDSLIFTAATANSANGRVALSYSTTGFTTDSIDFAAGKGPTGALAATANGTFGAASTTQPAAAPAVLPQYNAALTTMGSTFRFGFLSGGTGLTLAAGKTLTVRMYFRVGSDTEGRYFLLRNVILKSTQAALANRAMVSTNLGVYPNPTQNRLTVPHSAAKAGARVLVYSATGAKVASYVAQPGTTETAVDLTALAKGLYMVEYADGANRSSARIVKE
ncbi:T9SS type A sorting domain-containing protein [Hymenobacter sp. B1770]|uniref:T9SS type A sorting domain-containing protein n=1 Tax=Hymenobacter sp. B1770 TaxID=1718788 RepID=UPI003CEC8A33